MHVVADVRPRHIIHTAVTVAHNLKTPRVTGYLLKENLVGIVPNYVPYVVPGNKRVVVVSWHDVHT